MWQMTVRDHNPKPSNPHNFHDLVSNNLESNKVYYHSVLSIEHFYHKCLYIPTASKQIITL